jgi:hypothetical protein
VSSLAHRQTDTRVCLDSLPNMIHDLRKSLQVSLVPTLTGNLESAFRSYGSMIQDHFHKLEASRLGGGSAPSCSLACGDDDEPSDTYYDGLLGSFLHTNIQLDFGRFLSVSGPSFDPPYGMSGSKKSVLVFAALAESNAASLMTSSQRSAMKRSQPSTQALVMEATRRRKKSRTRLKRFLEPALCVVSPNPPSRKPKSCQGASSILHHVSG